MAKVRPHKSTEIAIEHTLNVGSLDTSACVLDELIRVQHVVADLLAPLSLHALATKLRLLSLKLLLLKRSELTPEHLKRALLVHALAALLLAPDTDSCGQVLDADRTVRGVDVLPTSTACTRSGDLAIALVKINL